MAQANFNRNPYFDDYSEDKNFYRILYRPGFAVQARELNQMQTILQNQIERHGKHIFREGSMVIPGQVSYDDKFYYARVLSTFGVTPITAAYLNQLVGVTVVGETSGVSGEIVHYELASGTDPITIYIKYKDSGADQETKQFAINEVLTPDTELHPTLTALKLQVEPQGVEEVTPVGIGSSASIERGVYFIRGFFVLVTAQRIILDKYTNTPTYSVGLEVSDDFVTPEEDPSLLDNSSGSFNFSAPGAHRYSISLTLVKKTQEEAQQTSVQDYIQLLTLDQAKVQQVVDRSAYSELEKTLARRTFDESGDYVVRNFGIDIREYRDNNRGAWAANTQYLIGDVVTNAGRTYVARENGFSNTFAPTQTVGDSSGTGIIFTYDKRPFYNRGIYSVVAGETLEQQQANAAKLSIGMEPGKAYVKGYEIEKLATNYITVPKARDFLQKDNVKVAAIIGNFVNVKNVHGIVNVEQFPTVDLYNRLITSAGSAAGTKIGTARARIYEYTSGTIGTVNAVYKVSLFDVRMTGQNDFNRNVKSLFINNGSAALNFTADIDPLLFRISGSATASASTTVVGNGSLFLSELRVGDYVSIGGNVRRVVTVPSNTSFTVDTAVTVTGEVIFRLETFLNETNDTALLFALPKPFARSTRDAQGNNNTSYTVTQVFDATVSSGSITLNVRDVAKDEFSNPIEADNYIIIRKSDGTVIAPTSYTWTSPFKTVSFAIAGSSDGDLYSVAACIDRTGAEKVKTRTLATYKSTTKATAQNTIIPLPKADVFKIQGVYMSTATGNFASQADGVYTIDITDRYSLDTGMRDTHYDRSQLVLNDGETKPVAGIRVFYEFYNHSAGDYFSVNSYSSVARENIPQYRNVSLTDVIDFRPRINDAGTGFTGTGAVSSGVPKRGEDLQLDFSYYIGRKDKISISPDGQFVVTAGASAEEPLYPNNTENAMLLYSLDYEPYTRFEKQSVLIQKEDNRRYTMRDIGRLEKRVDNLEYYTQLSLLEQDTKSLTIIDTEGFDRFKNGFFVDNFRSYDSGNVFSPDHKCAVDLTAGELRPFFYMDNINLVEKNVNNTQRTTANYKLSGDLITLPYTTSPFIQQLSASRVENVNPFAVFTFLGTMDLVPESDEWFETNRLPDIVTSVEGNFTAIKTALESAGALGVEWNSWQTAWTGRPEVVNFSKTGGGWVAPNRISITGSTNQNLIAGAQRIVAEATGGIARSISGTIAAREIGQTRTGIETSVVARVDRQVTQDRVVSTSVIPFMRSRYILFISQGLKPNTRYLPTFDGIRIDQYIRPAASFAVNTVVGEFDTTTNAGGDAEEVARRIDKDKVDTSLARGDVLYVKQRGVTTYTKANSPATAIVVATEDPVSGVVLRVVNVKGTFQANDVLQGSISGATATLVSTTIPAVGSRIVSNFRGDAIGLFFVPNTPAVRFRTGLREFKLDDAEPLSPGVTSNASTSTARKMFAATGILQTKQANVTATRNADVVRNQVNDSRTLIQTSQRITSDSGWYDPLAQTFMVQSKGGAFITAVDLFFATKDPRIPVQIEIREVVAGVPGRAVLPMSRVSVPANKVQLSNNIVTVDGVQYAAPDTPTRFNFPAPIYLNDNTEYALVVLSDSTGYNCWISQLGERNIGTDRIISEQPYMGVLFKSQNGSTWTPDQLQDLKFIIHRAQFDTANFAEIEFVNDRVPPVALIENPFKTTAGSNKVRVYHENHGMFPGSSVTITDAVMTGSGLTNGAVNATHIISDVRNDYYIITVGANATATGDFGGVNVTATENIKFSTMQPIVQTQEFTDTSVDHFVRTTSGKSVDGTEAPYTLEQDFVPVVPNDNNVFTSVRCVASPVNETVNMTNQKSLRYIVRMKSENPNVSPVLDTQRMSAVLVHNRIDQPTVNINVPVVDDLNTVVSTAIAAATNRFSTADSALFDEFLSIEVGKYITVTGGLNAGTYLVTDVAEDGSYIQVDRTLTTQAAGTSITIVAKEGFVDEIAPNFGTTASKYLTRKLTLTNPSTSLNIRFAADISQNANVDVYYRTNGISEKSFEKIPFVLMTPKNAVVKNNDRTFYDVEYDLEGMSAFTEVQVKLVMRSTNEAEPTRIKDLRIIACA
ncbi:virulence associated protein [Synechococcus phage BUCT-ZZ01]|nr:virulence associated protein [Synechococcus phage BUCT-ZZ01]